MYSKIIIYITSASEYFFFLKQNPQYDIKDSTGTLHSGITQTAAYYPYDHSLGQYQYDRWGLSCCVHCELGSTRQSYFLAGH